MNNKIDSIELQSSLDAIPGMSIEDGDTISKQLMSESAKEYTTLRSDFFSDLNNIDRIIKIGYKFSESEKILFQILTTLGFCVQRFGQSDIRIFDFIVNHVKNTNNKIRMAIARFLPSTVQFDKYDEKWNFILLIPQIPPKKDSGIYFYHALLKRYDQIPEQYKDRIITLLQGYLDKQSLDADTANKFTDLINMICKC